MQRDPGKADQPGRRGGETEDRPWIKGGSWSGNNLMCGSLIWGSLLTTVETFCLLLYSVLTKLAPFLLLWGVTDRSSLPNGILTFTQLSQLTERLAYHYLLPLRQYHR